MYLRCRTLVIMMFERVNGILEDNSPLEGILGELIICPSNARSSC